MFSTDGADLKRGYLAMGCASVPTIIMGPGQPALAHQTYEWCSMVKLDESVEMFARVMRDWNSL
jgi:succinyl-diaminopimelate desuccinylase